MKCFLFPIIFVMCFGLSCNAYAGTLENMDLDEYKVRVEEEGKIYDVIAYGQSRLLGICDYGGDVTLIKTGQTIKMDPNDEIVIEDGVMKRKKE